MTTDPRTQITQVLAARPHDAEALFPLVYDELRARAAAYLQRERPDHTLQPTALVNEAFLRLVDQDRAGIRGRAHFVAVAATVMRRILVDHARTKHAAKRGGDRAKVTLDERLTPSADTSVDLLALDDALDALARHDPRGARVVEMRFFGGMTIAETAEVLGVGTTTVEGDWAMARAWLSRAMQDHSSA